LSLYRTLDEMPAGLAVTQRVGQNDSPGSLTRKLDLVLVSGEGLT